MGLLNNKGFEMKKYQLISSVILLTLISTTAQADNNGFYIGTDVNTLSIGDDNLKVTNKDKSEKSYKNFDSSQISFKAGYQHFKNNRVEFYYRHNKLEGDNGDITTKTFGVNYEWAFSSIATDKLIPYALIGIGGGKASSSYVKSVDNAEVGEGSLGLGVHYQFTPHLDMQLGYTITSTGFDKFDNKSTDETSVIEQNKIIIGLAYKF